MRGKIKKIFKSWRVILVLLALLLSLSSIFGGGLNEENLPENLDYGVKFAGGIEIYLHLENRDFPDKPLTDDVIEDTKKVLDDQLNALGLRDITVTPLEGQPMILIEVAQGSSADIENIKNILKKQMQFEERIDGELAIKGHEVSINRGVDARGGIYGNEWVVSVKHKKEGACRFGKVGEGKEGRPVDAFINRPQNAIILMREETYRILEEYQGVDHSIYPCSFGDSGIDIIEKRSLIPIVVLKNNTNETISDLLRRGEEGYFTVIIAADEEKISKSLRIKIEKEGFKTERVAKGGKLVIEWIKELTGLKSCPRLNFNTQGECVYEAIVTGGASTHEQAIKEYEDMIILFSLANLPVRADFAGETRTPSGVGMDFLKYSFFAGLLAIFAVSMVIFVRYRKPIIVVPMMVISISEILITLGVASFIHWTIDLAAVIGIIVAVGTGIDDQIVITDETLRREKGERKIKLIAERIRRAFFIIFTAAATTIGAMMPLFTVHALKGFAFTTIVGILIGVFITRPAYGKIVEELLGE